MEPKTKKLDRVEKVVQIVQGLDGINIPVFIGELSRLGWGIRNLISELGANADEEKEKEWRPGFGLFAYAIFKRITDMREDRLTGYLIDNLSEDSLELLLKVINQSLDTVQEARMRTRMVIANEYKEW